jgi:lysophospholipase L1-like esterase
VPEVKPSQLLFYNICFACCFTLLLLGVIELTAALILPHLGRRGGFDRTQLSPYRGKSWGQQYWAEDFAAGRVSYQSYVGWKQLPYSGETITVGPDMNRATLNSDCRKDAYTVWMFGGSTMWGTGSPDWGTIPSQLAALLGQAGVPACVVNYGQTGWRNTQEVIELMLELKRVQAKPDLVIFYDGFNDGYSLYQSGKVDVHMNYDQVREQIERPSQRKFFGRLLDFLLTTHTGRLITGARPTRTFLDGGLVPPHTDEALAKNDLEIAYFRNFNFVSALAEQYGFQYAFFWQPMLFAGHKRLTEEEATLRRFYSSRLEGTDVQYRLMADRLRSGAPPHFRDISDVFDDVRDTIYIDFVHVDPDGNRLIAQRMYSELDQSGSVRSGKKPLNRPFN